MRVIYIVYREEVGPCPSKAKSKTRAIEPVGTHIVVSALTLLALSHEPGMDGTEHIAGNTPRAKKRNLKSQELSSHSRKRASVPT